MPAARSGPTDEDVGFGATSQLFFDDALNAEVLASGIYAAKGTQDMPNGQGGIYQQGGGVTTPDVARDGDGDVYRATFFIAV